mgnify:CR=1 FL=1
MKRYAVYEMIGNFSHMIYVSDNFYDVQDFLQTAFDESDCEDEELFYSYYSIHEV